MPDVAGQVVLRVGTSSLMLKRLPFGWLLILTDASGFAAMLPVHDNSIELLREFLRMATKEVG